MQLLALLLAALTTTSAGNDALLGTWIGDCAWNRGEKLVLRGDGTATQSGAALTWKVWGKDRIRYTLDGETERGHYTVSETALVLDFDGVEYSFKRSGKPRKKQKETVKSSATNPAASAPTKSTLAPKLEGVDAGPASRFTHPRGWFSFDMPKGWSVAEEMDDGLLLNPGLGAQDNLDALIFITYGELEPSDRNTPPAELVERYSGEIRRELGTQGIRLGNPKAPAAATLVGEVPGAVKEWPATAQGNKNVRLWLGSIVKREYYLTVGAVIVDAQTERFLPKTKRIFRSLEAKPPQRNPALERLLAGRSAGKYDVNDSGSFTTNYRFHEGGAVTKLTSFSGSPSDYTPVGMTDEVSGNYEVVGDVIYMYFASGQDAGVVSVRNGEFVGILFGETLYAAG